MKVRFGDKFNFEKEINFDYLNITIPSMILQPLVENCIRHGLANTAQGGIIKLQIYTTQINNYDNIIISISDNGKGFETETKQRLLAGLPLEENNTSIIEKEIGRAHV